MDQETILSNEKIKKLRERIRSTQDILNSRRTTVFVPGILLLGLISFGLGQLFSNDDSQFQFCAVSVLVSIVVPIVVANRVVSGNRKQVAQKMANEIEAICKVEGWTPQAVVDALYVHLSQIALFKELSRALAVTSDRNIPVAVTPVKADAAASTPVISPNGNRTLSIWMAVAVPYGLGTREGPEDWTVLLTPSALEFNCVSGKTRAKDGVTHFSLAREEANMRMRLRNEIGDIFQPITGSIFGTYLWISSLESVPGASSAPEIKYGAKFLLRKKDAALLRSWLDETPDEMREPLETKVKADVFAAMTTAIRGRGAGLVGWGIAHFIFSSLLEPAWGIVFVVIGLLNLAVPRRVLFIINGLALVVVGAWNGYLSVVGGGRLLGMFAAAQVVWGLEEVERFDHYSLANIRHRVKKKG